MKRKQRRWRFGDCYQVGQYHSSVHRKPKAPLYSNSIHVWRGTVCVKGAYLCECAWRWWWGRAEHYVAVSWYCINSFGQWHSVRCLSVFTKLWCVRVRVWRCSNCCRVSVLFGAVTIMTGVAACWLFIVHCTLWQPRNNVSIPGIEKFFLLPKTS